MVSADKCHILGACIDLLADHTNLSKGKWPREIPMGLLVVYLIKSDVTISYQCGIRPSSFDKTLQVLDSCTQCGNLIELNQSNVGFLKHLSRKRHLASPAISSCGMIWWLQ